MIAFIRRHPVASYFTLAFALSWGGILAIVLPGAIPASASESERLFPFVYLAMLVGPAVAGPVMAGLAAGRDGLRQYRAALTTWRVSYRWYAAALFTAPLVLALTLLALSTWSREFLPGVFFGETSEVSGPIGAATRASILWVGLVVGLGAGIFEELGWTGFATPALRRRHGVLATSLILGVAWGAWHFLAVYWGSAGTVGAVPAPVFLLSALFSYLLPYRVLMVLVYERTRSLPVAMLMHFSLTMCMVALGPQLSGGMGVAYNFAFSAALWITAVVALTWRGVVVGPVSAGAR